MPELILKHKGREVSRFRLDEGEASIGRVEGNDIVVPNPKVSRQHARIVRRGDGWAVEDAGSRKGCFIDGVRVTDQRLRDGDEIWIEDHCLVFREDEGRSVARPGMRFEEGRGGPDPDWGLLRTAFGDPRGAGEARLQVLFEIGNLVDDAKDFNAVLIQILDRAVSVMGAERGFLMLADHAAGELRVHVARDRHGDITGLERESISRGLMERVTSTRKPVLVHDAMSDVWDSASVMANSIHSAIGAPLLAGDEVVGVLYVDHRKRSHAFASLDLAFFAMFARQAKVAIDGSRAYLEIQRRLVEKERLAALGNMAAAVAHEIKNPLNFVVNFAEASAELAASLRGEIDELAGVSADAAASLQELAGDLADNAHRIRDHARRIEGIVTAMRSHASREARREPVDVNKLVLEHAGDACQGMRDRDPSLTIALETVCDEGAGLVTGVREDLEQVLFNLVRNACQAAAARRAEVAPAVSVRSRGFPERVEIRVRDNGAGVPAAIRGRVFEPFFTTRPPGEGMGLGLSLSHDIVVLRHRGEIRLETEEGRFTEIIVTLPRSSGVDAGPKPDQAAPTATQESP
jgi:signal transduction histidine kinase